MYQIQGLTPPIATKIPKEITTHEHIRIDNYYWLNDRTNTEVIEYLNSENAYTKDVLKDTEPIQEKIYNEIIGRIKQTDMSVPYFSDGYYYYTRYEEGKEYPVFCRKKESLNQPEEVMLDVNELATGHEYFQVSGLSVSPDNRMIIYGADNIGRRIYQLYFKNLETGITLPFTIQGTTGSASWANDNDTFFYSVQDEQTLRSYRIFRSKLSTAGESALVFEEKDETFTAFVYKSRSKEFLVIGSSATLSDEYWLLNANEPDGEFKIFQPRQRGLEYSIGHYRDKFYVRTNHEATNFKLMFTPVNATEIQNWQEFIPHRNEVFLESYLNFDGFLVIEERIKGTTQLRVIDMEDQSEHYIEFDEEVYSAWVSVNPEFSTRMLRLGYTSLTVPASVYDYHMETREMQLLKRQEVVGGHEPLEYKSIRLWTTANDGTMVPISLVYKKSTPIDGTSPLLLYGYGSYGITIDPNFSSSRLSLLDRGFIFAIAHIRGGQLLGRPWYDDGKLLKKKNTFTDFIACAKFLISSGYTTSENLMAMGGSAGGLLMGAVINLEPNLFKAIIAAVPFVDVVTTMLDETIPLTTGEYDEWGNPNDKTYFEYMLSYSPYDNVETKKYPNMLVTTGLHDSQVQYWEPAKWVAKLRELKTGNNLLLLHTNMDAGHGGASGRFKKHKETAMEYSFLLKMAGKLAD